jgi:serine/threonine-protein kinase
MNEPQSQPASDLAQQLEILWQQGQAPDIREFLSRAGDLTPDQVINALCVDQWHRWRHGDRIPAEAYLQMHPVIQTNPDKAFDLVYGEFLVREELGDEPVLDDFLKRFPQYAAEFQKQAKVHVAVESSPQAESTQFFGGPRARQVSSEAGSLATDGSAHGTGTITDETEWPAIPGYTILSKLGQGGMGQVFKAKQIRLDRVVALKVIRKDCLSQEPKAARRFQREAQAAAHLSHPNIIVVYDFNQVGDTYYIAMEYVDGVDLDQLVRECGPLPADRAVDLIRQAALGLQHAHVCGMVHRDIKPSNLLIALPKRREIRASKIEDRASTNSVPQFDLRSSILDPRTSLSLKILDMGMALLVHGPPGQSSHRTVQGTLMGTPDFIAPEQAVDSHDVDIRADLYSLGCTFYYLLAGRPPFSEHPLIKKLMMHQMAQAKPIREWRPDVPPGIEAVVERLMAKRPEDRYQTPGELAEVLAAPLAESIDPIFGPLAEAGILKGSPKRETAKRGSPETANRESEPTAKRKDIEALSNSLSVAGPSIDSPTPSLAPFPPVFPPSTERKSKAGVATGRDGQPESAHRVAVLKGHQTWVVALAFSPNRRTLACGAVHGTVRLWDFGTRRNWEKADLQTQLAEVHALAFSSDNRTLAVGSGGFDGLIWLWDLSAAIPTHQAVLQGHQTPVEAIAFSPDSKMLVSGGSDKTVRWWDRAEHQVKERAVFKGHFDRVKAVAFGPDGKTLISASLDGTVRLWRKGGIWSKGQLELLEGPWGPVHTMAVSSNLLAFGGLDQTVRLYSPPKENQSCQPVAVLRGHGGVIRQVAFPSKGDTLVSVCDAGRVIIWELASGNRLQEWQLPVAKMCSVAVSHDGRYLAAGTSDGIVNVFRLYIKTKEPEKPAAPG